MLFRSVESRIAKTTGVQFNFESGRNFGLRVNRPRHNARSIDRESIRTRRRQIPDRDFAYDSGCIARPIAHRLFAGEDHAGFGAPATNISDIETDRDDAQVKGNARGSAYHCLLKIAFLGTYAWISGNTRVVLLGNVRRGA